MLSGKLNKTAQNTSTRNAYQAAKTVSVCISRRVTIRINTLLRLCCWDYVHTKWFQTHPLRLRSGMIGEVCITKTLSSDYANFFWAHLLTFSMKNNYAIGHFQSLMLNTAQIHVHQQLCIEWMGIKPRAFQQFFTFCSMKPIFFDFMMRIREVDGNSE